MKQKIVIAPEYGHLKKEIEDIPNHRYEVLHVYCQHRNVVEKVRMDGKLFVVKRFKRPTLANCVIYTWFRTTKPKRAYDYATRLREAGINTPKTVAYIERSRYGFFHTGWIVTEYLPYQTLPEVYLALKDEGAPSKCPSEAPSSPNPQAVPQLGETMQDIGCEQAGGYLHHLQDIGCEQAGGSLPQLGEVGGGCPCRIVRAQLALELLKRDMADFTWQLHQKGIMPIDFNANNILVNEHDGHFHFALVDINRTRFNHVPSPRQAMRSMVDLCRCFQEFADVVPLYAQRRGITLDLCSFYILMNRRRGTFRRQAKRLIRYIFVQPMNKSKTVSHRESQSRSRAQAPSARGCPRASGCSR